jgi:hypothetical protein
MKDKVGILIADDKESIRAILTCKLAPEMVFMPSGYM